MYPSAGKRSYPYFLVAIIASTLICLGLAHAGIPDTRVALNSISGAYIDHWTGADLRLNDARIGAKISFDNKGKAHIWRERAFFEFPLVDIPTEELERATLTIWPTGGRVCNSESPFTVNVGAYSGGGHAPSAATVDSAQTIGESVLDCSAIWQHTKAIVVDATNAIKNELARGGRHIGFSVSLDVEPTSERWFDLVLWSASASPSTKQSKLCLAIRNGARPVSSDDRACSPVVVLHTSTSDAASVFVRYALSPDYPPYEPIRFRAYRSREPDVNEQATLLAEEQLDAPRSASKAMVLVTTRSSTGEEILSDPQPNSASWWRDVTLFKGHEIAPIEEQPYIVVVAEPANGSATELQTKNFFLRALKKVRMALEGGLRVELVRGTARPGDTMQFRVLRAHSPYGQSAEQVWPRGSSVVNTVIQEGPHGSLEAIIASEIEFPLDDARPFLLVEAVSGKYSGPVHCEQPLKHWLARHVVPDSMGVDWPYEKSRSVWRLSSQNYYPNGLHGPYLSSDEAVRATGRLALDMSTESECGFNIYKRTGPSRPIDAGRYYASPPVCSGSSLEFHGEDFARSERIGFETSCEVPGAGLSVSGTVHTHPRSLISIGPYDYNSYNRFNRDDEEHVAGMVDLARDFEKAYMISVSDRCINSFDPVNDEHFSETFCYAAPASDATPFPNAGRIECTRPQQVYACIYRYTMANRVLEQDHQPKLSGQTIDERCRFLDKYYRNYPIVNQKAIEGQRDALRGMAPIEPLSCWEQDLNLHQ